MIFVIITSTIGGLQIFAEPRLFDDTTARNGGSDRQFRTITMLIYDFGWQLRDLGRASATAWLLFLVICVFALVNFLLIRRVGATGGRAMSRRPGFLVYGLLTAFLLGSAAPLYWSFLLGSQTKEVAAQGIPPLLPGRPLLRQRPAGRSTPIAVLEGAGQQPDGRRRVTACSVVFFCTLAGFAFAKLRFRGRNGAAGVRDRHDGGADPARRHPALHPDGQARAGPAASGRGDRPVAGHRVRRVLHAAVPRRRRARRADRGGPDGRLLARSASSGHVAVPGRAPPRRSCGCSPSCRRGTTSSGR